MKDLKIKRAPVLQTSDTDMQRVIQNIYDDINDIIRSLQGTSVISGTEHQNILGKVGDFKVTSNESDEYELRVKTKDGWVKVKLDFVDRNN